MIMFTSSQVLTLCKHVKTGLNLIISTSCVEHASRSMVRRYPPNPIGTKNVFSDIRVLSIQIYVLSLSYLAMGINLVRDKGPRD